ncbi:hypothetical protein RDV64_08225 [Acuticoccus sp. MNP-M23]|uniref:hypothetical protein n=1 Tax=Acuticoccus sp. MNP-M23 TaxID=3072793 RepID=UPI002814B818|nr:hypothetical protein [Acuticoccus sp. MNP-M23]WMS44363.1 hypothetical protein RDV64_08225 [Acuticoccus sp. MNP-M23]
MISSTSAAQPFTMVHRGAGGLKPQKTGYHEFVKHDYWTILNSATIAPANFLYKPRADNLNNQAAAQSDDAKAADLIAMLQAMAASSVATANEALEDLTASAGAVGGAIEGAVGEVVEVVDGANTDGLVEAVDNEAAAATDPDASADDPSLLGGVIDTVFGLFGF